jgi:y4mF family transcriptional regulator
MRIDDAQTFGRLIKRYRKRRNISQSQLAAVANTGLRFIGDLEKGKPTVQLDKALRIAFLLGITLETSDVDGEPQ